MKSKLIGLARVLAAISLALGPLVLSAAPLAAQSWTGGTVYGWNCNPVPTTEEIEAEDGLYASLPAGGCYVEVVWSRALTPGDRVRVVGGSGTHRIRALIGGAWQDYGLFGDWTEFNVTITIDRLRVESATGSTLLNAVMVDMYSPTATAIPTATAFPPSQACIPANLVPTATPTRAFSTPTPFSLTPTATRTPGPSPTPAATATPAIAPIVELAKFPGDLSPWTANTNTPLVTWNSANGPDLQPGVASLPFSSAATINTVGDTTAAPGNLLVFSRDRIPMPARIVADIQSNLSAGQYAYLQLFYWQDAGLGTSPWTLAANIRVNVAWHTVTASIVPTGTVPVRAIGIRAVIGNGTIDNPLGFVSLDVSGAVQVDNLKLAAGANVYNSPAAVGLPVCVGGIYRPQVPTKACVIRPITVDVYASCTQPSDLLEIGGWIQYLACRISKYFEWNKYNQAQIDRFRSFLSDSYPVGPILEIGDVLYVVQDIIKQIAATNEAVGFWGYRWVDFDELLDWGAFSEGLFGQITPPDMNAVEDEDMFVCSLGIRNVPDAFRRGACWTINTIRDRTFLLPLAQWLLDIGALIGLVVYVQSTWMTRNE